MGSLARWGAVAWLAGWLFLVALAAEERPAFPELVPDLAYISGQFRFRMDGPAGWLGAQQQFDTFGQPYYKGMDERARFSWYREKPAAEVAGGTLPSLDVILVPRELKEGSPIEYLRLYQKAHPWKKPLKRPHTFPVGPIGWARADYTFTAGEGETALEIGQRIYAFHFGETLLLIQGTCLKTELGTLGPLFDKSVRSLYFDEDMEALKRGPVR